MNKIKKIIIKCFKSSYMCKIKKNKYLKINSYTKKKVNNLFEFLKFFNIFFNKFYLNLKNEYFIFFNLIKYKKLFYYLYNKKKIVQICLLSTNKINYCYFSVFF